MTHFSSLKSGTPMRISPPAASLRSKTTTRVPPELSWAATAIPAGPGADRPPPPGRSCVHGGRGSTQPSFQARSMICSSICLIVTGSSLISSTQAAWHGAGQM